MKNTRELHASGTYRESRHGSRIEGIALRRTPKPPVHLNQVEKKIFKEIASLMLKNHSVSALDVYSLEIYSVQLALFRRAKKTLEKTGEYVVLHVNKSGAQNTIPSPWMTILQKSNDALLKFGAKLGLSPQDRNKVSKVEGIEDPEEHSLLR